MTASVSIHTSHRSRRLVFAISNALALATLVVMVGVRPVEAQGTVDDVEIGVAVGRTHLSGDDMRTQEGLASFQLSAGASLDGRDLTLSYQRTDRQLAVIQRIGVGWRIEADTRLWRPFVEPGLTFASQSPDNLVDTARLTGPYVGAGLTVDLGPHLFFRPEVKASLLVRGPMLLREAWLGVGWRF